MTIEDWTFSSHSISRALDMALDAEELRLALTRPHWTRAAPPTSPKYRRL